MWKCKCCGEVQDAPDAYINLLFEARMVATYHGILNSGIELDLETRKLSEEQRNLFLDNLTELVGNPMVGPKCQ